MIKLATRAMVAACLLLSCTLYPLQQAHCEGQLRYDVASIKPSKDSSVSTSINVGNDSFVAHNCTLADLIQIAYEKRSTDILAIPQQLRSARFDVTAKILDPQNLHATAQNRREMLQELLQDRFGLLVRLTTHEGTIYAMRSSDPVKLHRYQDSSVGIMPYTSRISQTAQSLTAQHIQMSELAKALSSSMRRTIEDQTGIKNFYSFTLTWEASTGNDPLDNEAALLAALRSSLGITFQSLRGSNSVLMVEQAHQPEAD